MALGVTSSFIAECKDIILAMKHSITAKWVKIWIETDSQAAMKAVVSQNVPWKLKAEFREALRNLKTWRILHIYRGGEYRCYV